MVFINGELVIITKGPFASVVGICIDTVYHPKTKRQWMIIESTTGDVYTEVENVTPYFHGVVQSTLN